MRALVQPADSEVRSQGTHRSFWLCGSSKLFLLAAAAAAIVGSVTIHGTVPHGGHMFCSAECRSVACVHGPEERGVEQLLQFQGRGRLGQAWAVLLWQQAWLQGAGSGVWCFTRTFLRCSTQVVCTTVSSRRG